MKRRIKIGVCIYCGNESGLSTEHVIPLALGGELLLLKASCGACARVTSTLENSLLSGHWRAVRRVLDAPHRNRGKQRQSLPYRATATYGGVSREIKPQPQDFPGIVLPMFDEPAVLSGAEASGPSIAKGFGVVFTREPSDLASLSSPSGLVLPTGNALTFPVNYEVSAFVRFLAKVALGVAIADHGLDRFAEVFVRDLILGNDDGALTWVGELADTRLLGGKLPGKALAATLTRSMAGLVIVYLQLFRLTTTGPSVPIYQVVVGRLLE